MGRVPMKIIGMASALRGSGAAPMDEPLWSGLGAYGCRWLVMEGGSDEWRGLVAGLEVVR